MKNYLKDELKHIPLVLILFILFYGITTLATNYIFSSNEVSYDNTESGLHADSVQGAIDEVFQHATDYSEIKNTIGTGSLTTTSNTLIGGVNELNSKIPSVVNNLTSDSTTAALSAAQGKALNTNIAKKGSKSTFTIPAAGGYVNLPSVPIQFVMAYYRSSGQNSSDGYFILKFYDNTPTIMFKSGAETVSLVGYDESNNVIRVKGTNAVTLVTIY